MKATRHRQKTAQQSLKHRNHWSGGKLDAGEYKTAPEQFPTTPRERTEAEATRPKDFGWINGQF